MEHVVEVQDSEFYGNAAPSSATNTTPTSAVCEGTDVTLTINITDRYSNCIKYIGCGECSGTISSGDYVTGNISSDETVTMDYGISEWSM